MAKAYSIDLWRLTLSQQCKHQKPITHDKLIIHQQSTLSPVNSTSETNCTTLPKPHIASTPNMDNVTFA